MTTTHVINSAIVKLGKLMEPHKVYRGLCGRLMPDAFWSHAVVGGATDHTRGGIEFGFLSTSRDREVALRYATGGEGATLFEIQMGMVDRGATLTWCAR